MVDRSVVDVSVEWLLSFRFVHLVVVNFVSKQTHKFIFYPFEDRVLTHSSNIVPFISVA